MEINKAEDAFHSEGEVFKYVLWAPLSSALIFAAACAFNFLKFGDKSESIEFIMVQAVIALMFLSFGYLSFLYIIKYRSVTIDRQGILAKGWIGKPIFIPWATVDRAVEKLESWKNTFGPSIVLHSLEGKSIAILNSIKGYDRLKDILEEKPIPWHEEKRLDFIPYTESPEVFRYNKWFQYFRWTIYVLFSLILVSISVYELKKYIDGESTGELLVVCLLFFPFLFALFIAFMRHPFEFVFSSEGITANCTMRKPIVIPWNSVNEVQDYSFSRYSSNEKIKIKSTNGETIEIIFTVGGFYRIRKILREQHLKLGFEYLESRKTLPVYSFKKMFKRLIGR